MTETRAHVQNSTPASSRGFCVQHSALCAGLPASHQERRGESEVFLLFYHFTVFSKIALSVIINQEMSCWDFGQQIFVGHLPRFWQAAGLQSCLPLLPGCGEGQPAPAGARSAGRNVPVWSLSNVHHLAKVQFTAAWGSLTCRAEGSRSKEVFWDIRHFWQFLTHCIALNHISTDFVLLRFAMETHSENKN